MTTDRDEPSRRWLNVALAPGSAVERRLAATVAAGPPSEAPASAALAAGFSPQPAWNLTYFGGRTITDLVFGNVYLGPAGAWSTGDRSQVDQALAAAMSDAGLQSVLAQYYSGTTISSRMLASTTHPAPLPATVYKDTVESLVASLAGSGGLVAGDPASTVTNLLLPPGAVLSDGFSPGYTPPPGQADAAGRRAAATLESGPSRAADSKHGLGGYHGSVRTADGTDHYYAVGVYSAGDNGIVAFDASWKNVVATFYHELNEARTDADVEDVNATGNDRLLGWYSQAGGGEIGDLPIAAAGGDLSLVFVEVPLADGSGTVPVQLLWSNADAGPAAASG